MSRRRAEGLAGSEEGIQPLLEYMWLVHRYSAGTWMDCWALAVEVLGPFSCSPLRRSEHPFRGRLGSSECQTADRGCVECFLGKGLASDTCVIVASPVILAYSLVMCVSLGKMCPLDGLQLRAAVALSAFSSPPISFVYGRSREEPEVQAHSHHGSCLVASVWTGNACCRSGQPACHFWPRRR